MTFTEKRFINVIRSKGGNKRHMIYWSILISIRNYGYFLRITKLKYQLLYFNDFFIKTTLKIYLKTRQQVRKIYS